MASAARPLWRCRRRASDWRGPGLARESPRRKGLLCYDGFILQSVDRAWGTAVPQRGEAMGRHALPCIRRFQGRQEDEKDCQNRHPTTKPALLVHNRKSNRRIGTNTYQPNLARSVCGLPDAAPAALSCRFRHALQAASQRTVFANHSERLQHRTSHPVSRANALAFAAITD